MEYSSYNVNTPQWREITVGSHLPAELRKLAEIAHNLWWTWNDDVKKLYCDLDPGLWKEVMSQMKMGTANFGDGAEYISNIELWQQDGEQVIYYQMNTERLNSLIKEVMGQMNSILGSSGNIDVYISSADGESILTDNGLSSRDKVNIEMSMTVYSGGDSQTINMDIHAVLHYPNPGQPVDFALPATDGYTAI